MLIQLGHDNLNQLLENLTEYLEPIRVAKISRDYADNLTTENKYQQTVEYYQKASLIYQQIHDQTYCEIKMANLMSMHGLDLDQAIQLYQG